MEGTLSLFINCGETFRIENGEYFVDGSFIDKDLDYLVKVTKEEFKEYLYDCNWILSGWSNELKLRYMKMLKAVAWFLLKII